MKIFNNHDSKRKSKSFYVSHAHCLNSCKRSFCAFNMVNCNKRYTELGVWLFNSHLKLRGLTTYTSNWSENKASFTRFLPETISLRADDAGELSSTDVHWTWQRSTPDFNRVDHRLVLGRSAICNFRCLIPTNVVASFPVSITYRVRDEISRVLRGPAVRTLCSSWNHEDCWLTCYVANCTWRWFVK